MMMKGNGRKTGGLRPGDFRLGFLRKDGTDNGIENEKNSQRKRKRIVKAISILACIVAFTTTYALILPAVTLERQPDCGQTEHIHTAACYTYLDEDGNVVDPGDARVLALLTSEDPDAGIGASGDTVASSLRGGYPEDSESVTDAEPVAAPVDPTAENAGTDASDAHDTPEASDSRETSDAQDTPETSEKSDASGTPDTSDILNPSEASSDVDAMDDTTDDATLDGESADATDSAGTADPAQGTVRRVLICGMEEHQHSVECYAKNTDDAASDASSESGFPASLFSGLFGHDHDKSDESAESGQSDSSVESTESGDPVDSDESAESVNSTGSVESGKSAGSGNSADSADSNGSTTKSVTVAGTTITAEYEEGILPDDVTMQAVAVPADAYVGAVADAVGKEDTEIKTFDITFLSNEQEIEPSGEVKITFQADYITPDTDPSVVHITDDGSADLLETAVSDDEITLTTDSFSVYAISYTVDFHYEVNGKTYDFSIPGGGFVSLEHVVEVLGIASSDTNDESGSASSVENDGNKAEVASESATDSAGEVSDVSGENSDSDDTLDAEKADNAGSEDVAEKGGVTETGAYERTIKLNEVEVSEATKKFVANVERVEFSDSRLIWVGRVDSDTTVGDVRNRIGIDTLYSADLSQEQIDYLNAETILADDWLLVSLASFDTEEALTIKMKDGTSFEIKVTDPRSDSITNGNKYVIYYTSGTTNYALKNDGTVKEVSSDSGLNNLGDDYLWTFEWYNNGWRISSGAHYLNLGSVSSQSGNIVPTMPGNPISYRSYDASGGFYFYSQEYIRTDRHYYGYLPWEYWDEDIYDFYYMRYDNGSKSFKASKDTDSNRRIKLWTQTDRKYTFTVKAEYNNIYRGSVSGTDEGGTSKSNVASYIGITKDGNSNYRNNNAIKATAGTGYRFAGWRLGDTVLDSSLYTVSSDGKTSTIAANTLPFTEDNMVLTAMFEAIPNGGGVFDYSAELERWKKTLETDPLVVDKTAEVYDYDNRIYEVDITASADGKIIAPDLELAFVTDISRSMYFPADLESVGHFTATRTNNSTPIDLITELNRLRGAGVKGSDDDEVYYVIANPDGDATVYAFRYRTSDSSWYVIDASYDIRTHGKKGVKKDDDWTYYASTADSSKNRWKKITISEKSTNLQWTNNKLTLTAPVSGSTATLSEGIIYKASDWNYRLDYLQQAVDIASDVVYNVNPDATLGLVTFAKNSGTDRQFGFYGKDQYNLLIYNTNEISPDGGTNQKEALENVKNMMDNADSDPRNAGRQKVVIMITDGAPNQKGVTWGLDPEGTITEAAKDLKNSGVTLYTVGLSVGNVKDGTVPISTRLAEISSKDKDGNAYSYTAENGKELISAIEKIVESFFIEVDLVGTVIDTVDPAFYPVNTDGEPLQIGYYNDEGTLLSAEQVSEYIAQKKPYHYWSDNQDNTWTVTWYNEKITKTKTDASGNTIYGCHKSLLIKAKEDFLGGNTINTNRGNATVMASEFKARPESGKTTSGELSRAIVAEDSSPYVNIDELSINHNSTEWTVYLGTEVDPMTQLKELFQRIEVSQVVTEVKSAWNDGGIYGYQIPTTEGKTIYEVEKGAYKDDDVTLVEDRTPSTIPIGTVLHELGAITGGSNLSDEQWSTLISGKKLSFKYYGDVAYGHGTEDVPVGVVEIQLAKDIVSGEGSIPDAHATAVTNEQNGGKAVEKYTLSVTYVPTPPTKNLDEYKTGTFVNEEKQPGVDTGSFNSTNKHIINVFVKKFQIEKKDKDTGELITDYPATFTLYKSTNSTAPAKASDIVSDTGNIASGYNAVATLATKTTATATTDVPAGKTEAYDVVPLNFGMFSSKDEMTTAYYLVETEQPEGYIKSTEVWPVTLTFSETPTGTDGAAIVASDVPYNWTQTATLTVGDQTSSDDSDTVTVSFTVENEKGIDIEILKVDEKGEPLDLATFRLQIKDGSYQDIKGIKVSSGSEDLKYPAVGGLDENSSFVSGTEKVTITKLPDGEYKLVEDSTHDGYIIKQKEIEFTIAGGVISGTDIEGTVKFEGADGTTLALITITNEPGAALPNTGGSGTTAIYLAGILLTGLAGVGLVMRRRRRKRS